MRRRSGWSPHRRAQALETHAEDPPRRWSNQRAAPSGPLEPFTAVSSNRRWSLVFEQSIDHEVDVPGLWVTSAAGAMRFFFSLADPACGFSWVW